MKIYKLKSTFGWEGDDGLGEQLIQQILAGEKPPRARRNHCIQKMN